MSGPDTRTWGDIPLGFDAKADNRSAQLIQIDKSSAMLGIVALVVACVALGAVLVSVLLMPQVTDAKIAAAIAPANEVARTAAQNAKLAEDRANKMAAMLEARGLIKLENH